MSVFYVNVATGIFLCVAAMSAIMKSDKKKTAFVAEERAVEFERLKREFKPFTREEWDQISSIQPTRPYQKEEK